MINWDRVRSLRDDIGNEEFDEIVEIFLEEVQEVVDKLRDAPVVADLEFDLHALKNGALNLGFMDLSGLCQTGERRAAQGDGVAVDLQQIVGVFESSRRQFLTDLPTELEG